MMHEISLDRPLSDEGLDFVATLLKASANNLKFKAGFAKILARNNIKTGQHKFYQQVLDATIKNLHEWNRAAKGQVEALNGENDAARELAEIFQQVDPQVSINYAIDRAIAKCAVQSNRREQYEDVLKEAVVLSLELYGHLRSV